MNTDIVIIGAGPVGIFAAFQAGMLGMKSIVIDVMEEIGGQCSALYPEKAIYDIPSRDKILAVDLIKELDKQAQRFKPVYLLDRKVIGLKQNNQLDDSIVDGLANNNVKSFEITTSKGDLITAKAIIIAAGAGCFGPKKPPLQDIEYYEGKSIFYNIKQLDHFKDKTVVIAGGGDSALDWSIILSKICRKIYLVHRRNKFRAMQSSIDQLYQIADSDEGNIEVLTNYQLHSLEGEKDTGVLSHVNIYNLNQEIKKIQADCLLPFFGLSQNLGPIANFGLNLQKNYINVTQPYYQTNIDSIYAVGDIAHYAGKLKLILTGYAEVASSLHHLYPKIHNKALHFEYSTSKLSDSNLI